MNTEHRTRSDRLFRSHERLTTHGSHGELEIVAAQAGSSFDDESLTSSLNLAPSTEPLESHSVNSACHARIFSKRRRNVSERNLASESGAMPLSGTVLAGKTLAEIEQLAITETLQSTGGNKAMAARILGISEKSIYNKMKRFQDRVS